MNTAYLYKGKSKEQTSFKQAKTSRVIPIPVHQNLNFPKCSKPADHFRISSLDLWKVLLSRKSTPSPTILLSTHLQTFTYYMRFPTFCRCFFILDHWLDLNKKQLFACFLDMGPETKCKLTFDSSFWYTFLCSFAW